MSEDTDDVNDQLRAVASGNVNHLEREADQNKSNALYHATTLGHTDIVKSLLDKGAGSDQADALYHATILGHTVIVKLLLDRGANPNQSCVLYHAAIRGHTDIVKSLLEQGANPDMSDALYHAAEFGHTDIVKLLLDNGANPNQSNVLYHSSKRGQTDIVNLLLDKINDPNQIGSPRKKEIPATPPKPADDIQGAEDKMVKLDDLRQTTRLQCHSSNERRWVEKEHLYVWFKCPDRKNSVNETTIKEIHAEMLRKLSDWINPNLPHDWKTFQTLITAYLSRVEVFGTQITCLYDICNTLMDRGIIDYGKYDTLRSVVIRIHVEAAEIIDEASSKITSIKLKDE